MTPINESKEVQAENKKQHTRLKNKIFLLMYE